MSLSQCVSFIAVLNTAAGMGCPGGCRLSGRKSCRTQFASKGTILYMFCAFDTCLSYGVQCRHVRCFSNCDTCHSVSSRHWLSWQWSLCHGVCRLSITWHRCVVNVFGGLEVWMYVMGFRLTFYSPVVTICTTSLTFTILHSAHTVHLCVLCGSENKQRLFPYTALTDWFL